MLGLEDVEPLPVPRSPAMMQEMPSMKIPLGSSTVGLVPIPPSCSTALRGCRGAVRCRGGGNTRLYLLMACTGGGGAPASRAQE